MDDNYWWQLIDSDEHWQWEQTQRMQNLTGKPSSGNQTQSGLPNTTDTNLNSPDGQEQAA